MESNIFTTFVYLSSVFAAVLSVIVLLLPLWGKYDHVFVFNKKVGPKYWGRYEGTSEIQDVGTIEVKDPYYTDKVTFGSRAYSSGSTGV